MKDRFKFRAWDNENNKYIYDAQDTYDNPWCECFGYMIDCFCYEDRFVIEQCTGLKDKNGRLIYEGDIIRKENQRFIIKYDFDSFKAYDEEKRPISIYGLFTFKICSGGWPEKETENTIEVIGNIHENPDLVEALR